MLSATHTHSASSAMGNNRLELNEPLDEYSRFVARRVADAVACAVYTLRPARVGWTSALEPRHVFCRRWFMKPGTMPENPFGSRDDLVKMNPGRQNPGLDKPAGPVDPEIFMLAARTPEGQPIGMLANYSLPQFRWRMVISATCRRLISISMEDMRLGWAPAAWRRGPSPKSERHFSECWKDCSKEQNRNHEHEQS